MRVVALFSILCGVLFVYGFLTAERLRLKGYEDARKNFYVMTTLPRVMEEARWVRVYLCAAELREDAGIQCIPGGWDATSQKQTWGNQRQYEFPWGRYIPRGTLQISAVVLDGDFNALARGQTVVMR